MSNAERDCGTVLAGPEGSPPLPPCRPPPPPISMMIYELGTAENQLRTGRKHLLAEAASFYSLDFTSA